MIGLAAVFLLTALIGTCTWCGRRWERRRAWLEQAVRECFAGREWWGRVVLRVRPRLVRSGGDVRLDVIAWTGHEVMDALGRVTDRLPADVEVTVDATIGFDAPRVARLTARGTRRADGRHWTLRPAGLAAPHRNGAVAHGSCPVKPGGGGRGRRWWAAVAIGLLLAGCGARGDPPSTWRGQRQQHGRLGPGGGWGIETAELVFDRAEAATALGVRMVLSTSVPIAPANVAGFLEVRAHSGAAVYRVRGEAYRILAGDGTRSTFYELIAQRLRGAATPAALWLFLSVDEVTGAAELFLARTPRIDGGDSAIAAASAVR